MLTYADVCCLRVLAAMLRDIKPALLQTMRPLCDKAHALAFPAQKEKEKGKAATPAQNARLPRRPLHATTSPEAAAAVEGGGEACKAGGVEGTYTCRSSKSSTPEISRSSSRSVTPPPRHTSVTPPPRYSV